MRKLFIGFCLILLMSPLTTVLADGNGHLEQTYTDSNGVSAQDLTFDKNLDFSHEFNWPGGMFYCFRINLQTESSVKVIISGDHFSAGIEGPDGKTLDSAEPNKNEPGIISRVLYHGMYYIYFINSGPEGSRSKGNLRIIINPV